MFSQACSILFTGGSAIWARWVSVQRGWVDVWSEGGGGCLVRGGVSGQKRGRGWFVSGQRGVSVRGGVSVWSEGVSGQGGSGQSGERRQTPPRWWLLLRSVLILLECILVSKRDLWNKFICYDFHSTKYTSQFLPCRTFTVKYLLGNSLV